MLDESPEAQAAPLLHEYPVADIGQVLQALADPMRLAIVQALAGCEGELYCGAIDLPVTKATMTHHFRTLKFAGLISGRMEGTRKYLRLRKEEVDAVYPGLLDSVLNGARASAPAATAEAAPAPR